MFQDVLRIYDGTVKDWVSSFLVEGQFIDTTFATPDRPYGKFDTEEKLRSSAMKNPVVSITRMDLVYDPSHRMDGFWYSVKDALSGSNRPVIASQYPKPYRIPYQLDLRARRRQVANLWSQWIYFNFNPIKVLKANFADPWGWKKFDVTLQGRIVDNSDLEPQERERWIRLSATIEVLAFLYPSVTDLGADIPDAFGQISNFPDVRHIQVDTYVSKTVRPEDPSNQLVDSQRRDVVEAPVSLPVESQGE